MCTHRGSPDLAINTAIKRFGVIIANSKPIFKLVGLKEFTHGLEITCIL